VLNNRSYPKTKTGYPFFWTTLYTRHKSHFCPVLCLLDSIWLILFFVDSFYFFQEANFHLSFSNVSALFCKFTFFAFIIFWRILSLLSIFVDAWCIERKINSFFFTASTVPQMLCYLILSPIEFTEQHQKSTNVVSVWWHFTFYFILFMFHIWWAAFCCFFSKYLSITYQVFALSILKIYFGKTFLNNSISQWH